MELEFSQQDFEKNNKTPNFMKIRPVAAELFDTDGDMTKLIVALRNFAYAPIKLQPSTMSLRGARKSEKRRTFQPENVHQTPF
jgi:hypothetical protein